MMLLVIKDTVPNAVVPKTPVTLTLAPPTTEAVPN